MAELPEHGIPLVHEEDASEEVREIYESVKRDWQVPFVPNIVKGVAASPAALNMYVGMANKFYEHVSLPQALVSIICFTIAEKSNCMYCAASHELTCRTLGVDEETLRTIAHDLGEVNPERIRTIIEFALKVAKHPQELEAADYDAVRAHGITNEEIVEIVIIAGVAMLSDIVADGLKIEVDSEVADALAQ